MVGVYAPKTEVQPAKQAGFGMLWRGHCEVKSIFVDDEKNVYLEWEWSYDITKDWN